MLPGGEVYHSPHMQSRLLQNFNEARQTLKKAKPPTHIHPIQNLEMTPQMDTFSLVEPSIIVPPADDQRSTVKRAGSPSVTELA